MIDVGRLKIDVGRLKIDVGRLVEGTETWHGGMWLKNEWVMLNHISSTNHVTSYNQSVIQYGE